MCPRLVFHLNAKCRDALYQWNARLLSLEEIPLINGNGRAIFGEIFYGRRKSNL